MKQLLKNVKSKIRKHYHNNISDNIKITFRNVGFHEASDYSEIEFDFVRANVVIETNNHEDNFKLIKYFEQLMFKTAEISVSTHEEITLKIEEDFNFSELGLINI